MNLLKAEQLNENEVAWLDLPGQGTVFDWRLTTHQMFARYEYHGEYDDLWFVEMNGDVEVTRYNARYVLSVCWKEKP